MIDLKPEVMRDEQMYGVWSMCELLSSDFCDDFERFGCRSEGICGESEMPKQPINTVGCYQNIYYLPDSDTRILEAVNNQLTASPSDQDYRRAVLKAKHVGIALIRGELI